MSTASKVEKDLTILGGGIALFLLIFLSNKKS